MKLRSRSAEWLRTPQWHWWIGILLVIGIGLRCANLDHKVYWGDEAYTSIRVSGYTTAELVQTVAQGQLVTASTLMQFQRPAPDKGIKDTVAGLIKEEAQLTPLYFVSLRLWAQALGSTPGVICWWSVLFGILCLPCVYWLCQELFQSPSVSGLAMGLIAVSPLHLIYAQEARMYSLWIWLTLASSATLLQALRSQTWKSWLLTTLLFTLALYTSLLTVVCLVGDGVYILALSGWRWSRALTAYLGSALTSLLLFSPWIVILWQQRVQDMAGGFSFEPLGAAQMLGTFKHWGGIFSRTFIDFNVTVESPRLELVAIAGISGLLMVLIGYSFYVLVKRSPARVWGFIVILCLAFPIAMLPRSLSDNLPPRYIIPTLLGVELTVAYALATQIQSVKVAWQQVCWRIVTVLLMSLGVVSCALNVQAETWWNKQFSGCNPQIARTINATANPLILSDGTGGIFDDALSNILSLSHRLKPTVQFKLVIEPQPLQIPEQFKDIYVVTPSSALREQLAQNPRYQMMPLQTDPKAYRDSDVCLWKLIPKAGLP